MAPKKALWAWATLVAALYAVLAYGSYVTLPSHAGGLVGFDMRPFGMTEAEGAAYLDAISDTGRDYYLTWLKPLDTVFIVAITLFLLALSWTIKGLLGGFGAIDALAYAVFDWLENGWVGILMAGPTKDDAEFVVLIATVTTAKFLSLGCAAIALLVAWARMKPTSESALT